MKIALLITSVLLVACTHNATPPQTPEVINVPPSGIRAPETAQIPSTELQAEIETQVEVLKTWGDSLPEPEKVQLPNIQDLHKAMEAAVKGSSCQCQQGDPLCPCL